MARSPDESVPHTRSSPRPSSLSDPLPRSSLPPDLQTLVDDSDSDDFLDSLYSGSTPDTTDTPVRYAAYAARARTILLSAQRYVAYTSDIGESFRPVAHPWLVRGAYGVSWAYLLGDVGHEGYRAWCRNQKKVEELREGGKEVAGGKGVVGVGVPAIEDFRAVMVQRAVFQGVASMGLPAFTIHSLVKYSGKAMKNVQNVALRTWGPIGLGLAAVPALPYMFDQPVEDATDWLFYKAFRAVGGEKAVGDSPVFGRHIHQHPAAPPVAESKKDL